MEFNKIKILGFGALLLMVAAGCDHNISIQPGNSNNSTTNTANQSSNIPANNSPVNSPAANSNTPSNNSTSSVPKSDNGIFGIMTIGPSCPGPAQINQSCPDKPYQGTVDIKDSSGKIVASVTGDANGKFKVALPAGQYTVVPREAKFPRARSQTATVKTGQFTEVNISYDSGIR